jgi:hypothetical protein
MDIRLFVSRWVPDPDPLRTDQAVLLDDPAGLGERSQSQAVRPVAVEGWRLAEVNTAPLSDFTFGGVAALSVPVIRNMLVVECRQPS